MLKILVTGSAGQLGCEMQRLGALSPNEYIFTDLAELDITDRNAVSKFMEESGAQVVINCAAYTNVEKAEDDEAIAHKINALAAENLAIAAHERGAVLIHISTDYVFDGHAYMPYTEDHPTNPQSVYGRTKLAGEQAIIESGCRYLIFRTSWLYSAYGNNFLKTMLKLTSERETMNVVFDQIGTPTYAGDLALGVYSIIEGGLLNDNEGVYHFSNEGVCSWYDFAVEIARAVGHDKCQISPCRSEQYPTKAARPAYSVLDKSKLKLRFGIDIPHWRESMYYCLKQLSKQ